MHIDPDETVAGIPLIEIRDALRRAPSAPYAYPRFIAERLALPLPWAREIVTWLTEQGYLQLVSKRPKHWAMTTKGHALAGASAAKPLHRATADRLLKAFMTRVQEVNTNEYYLYRVVRVVVFGSYLSDKERLSDVDIAVDLKRKHADFDEHQRLERLHVKEAQARGRVFSWWYEEDQWAEKECMLFLKSRSRGLSLHYWEGHAKFIRASTHSVLYEEPESKQPADS